MRAAGQIVALAMHGRDVGELADESAMAGELQPENPVLAVAIVGHPAAGFGGGAAEDRGAGRDHAGQQQCRLWILQPVEFRSEEHTSELQSLMRISYAVFC